MNPNNLLIKDNRLSYKVAREFIIDDKRNANQSNKPDPISLYSSCGIDLLSTPVLPIYCSKVEALKYFLNITSTLSKSASMISRISLLSIMKFCLN